VRSETTSDWWNSLGEKYYSVMGNGGLETLSRAVAD